MLHDDITAGSRTNRSAMLYHPSRLVTLPFHYIEMSLSLSGEESGRLEGAPPFPSQLNGAQRQVKSEVFDLFCELGADEALLNKSMVLDNTLSLCLKEVQLLEEVCIILVKLSVLVDIHEESPVIEVVDCILENGIGCPVAPEVTAEPGGEQLQRLVRGESGEVYNSMICASSSPLASLCSPVTLPSLSCLMKQVNRSVPSSRGMVKFRRHPLFSSYPGGHLARPSPSSLICCWSMAISASSPSTFSLWTSSLILMVLVSPLIMLLNWSGDRLGVAARTKDILDRSGREGESPRINGGNRDLCPLLSEVLYLEGVICSKAEMPREAFSGLFRG